MNQGRANYMANIRRRVFGAMWTKENHNILEMEQKKFNGSLLQEGKRGGQEMWKERKASI